MADDLTTELLEQIRDGIRGTNERIDEARTELSGRIEQTNERIDQTRIELSSRIEQTNERLDGTNHRLDRLEHRQVESETRLATELVAVAGAVNEVRDLLRDHLALAPRVEDHEHRLRKLEQRES